MPSDKPRFINREISWLSFNERVLQEAGDPTVPLIERIKFLGIFSNNMDEFFRVRVATLKRMDALPESLRKGPDIAPRKVLNQIQDTVIEQRHKFDRIYADILKGLEKEHIYIISEAQLSEEQGVFVRSYFRTTVRPTLVPIMLDSAPDFPMLRDKIIYLAIKLSKKDHPRSRKYALIELPTDIVPRFLVLPAERHKQYIILLDDVIRYCLDEIFYLFDYDQFDAYTIKLTRDAELDLDDDLQESFLHKISKSLKQRRLGRPVRFIYDETMPHDLLQFLFKRLGLQKKDNLIAGARYHNFKDFIRFPTVGRPNLRYKVRPTVQHPDIRSHKESLFSIIRKKDLLLHYPYQPFDNVIDLLREAAIDPQVQSVKITLYRMAENSNIVNALINAVKNGKAVTAVVELQARFDEENNILMANRLREEGAKVIFGVPGMKVHSKLCLITRKEKNRTVRYAHVGTGNFNEFTARLYSDHALLTADERITQEVGALFQFFDNNLKATQFKHLLVSPWFMRAEFLKLIETEIRNVKAGKEAWIILKLNSLVDQEMIAKLYEAGKTGVKIRLIIRSICSLQAGVPGLSDNIEAISIVDRYLEHSRIFVFAAGGKEKVYFGSADWMTRNLDHRIEVICPVYDEERKKELRTFLEIQLSDNMKARLLNIPQDNAYKGKKSPDEPELRAQSALHDYFKSKSDEIRSH